MHLAQNQLLNFYNYMAVTKFKRVDLCLPVIVVYAEIKVTPTSLLTAINKLSSLKFRVHDVGASGSKQRSNQERYIEVAVYYKTKYVHLMELVNTTYPDGLLVCKQIPIQVLIRPITEHHC